MCSNVEDKTLNVYILVYGLDLQHPRNTTYSALLIKITHRPEEVMNI